LQVMVPYLDKIIKNGKKILSVSIDSGLRESVLADGLLEIQNRYKNIDIGSYPYFKDKPGTVLVLRSVDEIQIKKCETEVKKLIQVYK